ncbi:MAG: hypothetical protein AW08_03520 [Candidatus Accumulibacter adjunctus]|uniref:Uncharacterized protein n=1 Tax=Candidatus Accumulibacter adjunctus TaxID=1454001 RepID=A0A011NKF2_9PROT|nr:MAG: hypothetical protein AW08_03520 [Candidatus Accumulibacter adjunctus]
MSARWRNQRRQALDQFERRQHRSDAAAAACFDAFMDQMVGVDFTQTLQREGGASTVAQQPFQALAVGRFDAQPSVERQAVTVIPARHRLGVFRLSWIGSILGAMLILFVFRLVNKLAGRSSAIRCGLSPLPFPASAASSGLRRRLQCRRRDRDDALGQQARLVVIVDNHSERAAVSGDEFR